MTGPSGRRKWHAPPATPPFPPPFLPDVTLVAVTSVALLQTVRAIELSLEQARFGAVFLIGDQPPPPRTSDRIGWRRVAPIASHAAYSRFMLHELRHHVATSHVLCVQWDGYVLDGRGWDGGFLDYDYIGAPWPQFDDGHVVGNGGFSLRSKRLLDACHALGIDAAPEDVAICRTHRSALEDGFGIRFAPEDVARRFAFERHPCSGAEFGFHGVFNLARLVGPRQMDDIIAHLDPAVLNRREHRELLRFALRRGRLGLARTILRRLRQGAGRR
ncbi:DUF5672 family protein [Sphingomonas bacterium]|uniref:DUF5672 family protein n=1 Tax=Sphingomonas bacterium TaxID=1895847 RepID=UPI0015770B01|nr:DUF5672 family protein [Sphingomonas bacterium]